MAVIGELMVAVSARITGFLRGMTQAQKKLTYYQKSVLAAQKATQRFQSAIGLIGVSLSAGAFISGIKNAANEIDSLAKTADKLGLATEKLAGLRLAGEETGIATNTLDMALQRMVRRTAEAAKGTGEAKDALRELGIDAKKLAKLSPDQQLGVIADKMNGVATQGDKVRLAFKLFDSEGVALVNTLKLGSKGLTEYTDEAKRLGIAVDREAAAKVEKLNDELGRLKKAFVGLNNEMLISVAPEATRWVEGFTKAVSEFREGAKLQAAAGGKSWADKNIPWTKAVFGAAMRWSDARTDAMVRAEFAANPKGESFYRAGPDYAAGGKYSAARLRGPDAATHARSIALGERADRHRAFEYMVRKGVSSSVDGLMTGLGTGLSKSQEFYRVAEKYTKQAGSAMTRYQLRSALRGSNSIDEVRKKQAEDAKKEHADRIAKMVDETRRRSDQWNRERERDKDKNPRVVQDQNRALVQGTVEAYTASRANTRGYEVAKSHLTEAKKQSKLLDSIIKNTRDPFKVNLVMIPG